ncbi:MAG: VWA domain-containing protein [Actinomyces sp.]|uniref:vWA domain-containing protein n=1 Tax=Actinomyces sp. TaxID=29317 RepID=UPI0026DA9BDE|nr:VWA domain-containing protein [Actinomyces sp.]MDO4243957.1 VWA domain-containing protein [Actinomyces sp.]
MVMPWIFLLLLVLAFVAVVVTLLRPPSTGGGRGRHGRASSRPRRVANSAPLLLSPVVRSRLHARRWLHALMAVLVITGLVAASFIAGRPVKETIRNEALASRDIVLCLDVSTSMVTTDAKILETFSEMLDTFDGERVALVAWNTTAQTIVPLTDDYVLLEDELNNIADVLDFNPYYGNPAIDRYAETFAGTVTPDVEASSLIGDGLASCAMAFGHNVADRSRSIVLASDNQVQDPDALQIYSLSEAADLAAQEDIRLFSLFGADPELIDPSVSGKDVEEARDELEQVTTEHNDRFYEVDDADAAGSIVEEMEAEQVDELGDDTQVRRSDVPHTAAWLLALVVLAFLALTAWRKA